MAHDILVAGGGIAGLAAAVGARAAGWEVRLCEKAEAFGDAGAGRQLGPYATRILDQWGLLDRPGLRPFEPQRLSVRDAVDGRELGSLRLGAQARQRYGSPYLTLHRADLHSVLLDAAAQAGAHLHPGVTLTQAASMVSSRRPISPEARRSRPTRWRSPTASGARCAASSSATAPRPPAAMWPIARCCRWRGCRPPCARPKSRPGWVRACT